MPLAALQHSSHDRAMVEVASDQGAALARRLLGLTARLGARSDADPFGNPVLLLALAISRRIDTGELSEAAIGGLVRHLRDAAFADRARRLAAYVGGVDPAENDATLAGLAQHLLRPDPNDSPVRWAEYRALVERTRFAAVFTAHPTFALPPAVGHALADAASGRAAPAFDSHRPPPVTLADEFAQAVAAIANGRDALDRLNAALMSVARSAWPDRWTELTPRPVVLSSWVGYDTDGRTDIGWWDTLRLRLEMKRLQLAAAARAARCLPAATALAARVAVALEAVGGAARRCCPTRPIRRASPPSPTRWSAARETALTTPAPLLPLFQRGDRRPPEDHAQARAVRRPRRAGLARPGAGAHAHAAERGADPQRGAPAAGDRRPAGGPGASPRAVRRDQRRAGRGAAGAGRFRRAAGRAGLGGPADDDGGADRQAHRWLDAGALPDRRDRNRLHAAGRAVAGAAVRRRAAHRDQPAVRDGGGAGTRRARAGRGAAQPALPRLSASRPGGWRCNSAIPIPAAMSASSPPAT